MPSDTEKKIAEKEGQEIDFANVHPDAKWFVVHTLSGHELKIKRFIESNSVEKKLDHLIGKVFVPMEDVVEMHRGKKRVIQRKYFPGYILINMVLTKETEAFIRSVPGVTGFVMSGGIPMPLSQEEIEMIAKRTQKEKAAHSVEIPFAEGDPVRVVDGPFKDFTGIVSDINREKGKVRVMVSIFGRLTPVDVDVLQLREDKK